MTDFYDALGMLVYDDTRHTLKHHAILICDARKRQHLDPRAHGHLEPVRHQVMGIPVEVDDAVPRDEVWLVNQRREVVKIVNLEAP